MAETVTENPVGLPRNWTYPAGLDGGVPRGDLVFQNSAVVIPAAVTETILITITCGLPIGFVYKITHCDIILELPDLASSDEWAGATQGKFIAFSPGDPAGAIRYDFSLPADFSKDSLTPPAQFAVPYIADASALENKIHYGPPAHGLPSIPLLAQTATTNLSTVTFMTADTTSAGELSYYIRFLVYTIEEDNQWRMHSPVSVIDA